MPEPKTHRLSLCIRSLAAVASFTCTFALGQTGVQVDTFDVESQSASGQTSSIVLEQGKSYVVNVQGTFSYWDSALWAAGVPCGIPDAQPLFPSGTVTGPVGADPGGLFAAHAADPACTSVPFARTTIAFNTSSGWYAPVPAMGALSPDHSYAYPVVGQGAPLDIRVGDGVYSDNYGSLRVRIFDPAITPGRILAAHDVNTLSSSLAGSDELIYAVNLARWLAGGPGARILALESSTTSASRDYSQAVRDAWSQAGFQVDFTQRTDWTLAELGSYDAVFGGWTFPQGSFFDPVVLEEFVQLGGGVFVFGGVGSSASAEAQVLNGFLSRFGLEFESSYNGLGTAISCNAHPVMSGVTRLRGGNGQSLVQTDSQAPWFELGSNQDDLLFAALGVPADDLGSVFCSSTANSTGAAAEIFGLGTPDVLGNDVWLGVTGMPPGVPAIFLASQTRGMSQIPGGGTLCLSGSIGRYSGTIQDSGPSGCIGQRVDLGAIPSPNLGFVAAQAGQTWSFQAWFRDGPTSNLSSALEIPLL